MWDGRSFILWNEQGLTPFVPHHTSPPCMETQNTPTFIPNHPTTHPHRNTMQYATTCKATNMQQYNLWTQRREMGTGHREGVGPTTTMSCSTHQWVHWCACLTSKDQLSSISPSPSIAWHRWCCTCRPLGNPLTHRKSCKTHRNPYLWVPVQVQPKVPGGYPCQYYRQGETGWQLSMIKDVDWTIGTKVNGKKPKWQKCISIVES